MKGKNLLYQMLAQAQALQQLVEVYSNTSDRERFIVGYVLAIGEENILLHLIDEVGLNDGYRLQALDSIIDVCSDTIYLKNLAPHAVQPAPAYSAEWDELLMRLIEDRQLVALRDEYGSNLYGYIREFDDDGIWYDCIDLTHGPDGHSVIQREDLRGLFFGTPRLQQVAARLKQT